MASFLKASIFLRMMDDRHLSHTYEELKKHIAKETFLDYDHAL